MRTIHKFAIIDFDRNGIVIVPGIPRQIANRLGELIGGYHDRLALFFLAENRHDDDMYRR